MKSENLKYKLEFTMNFVLYSLSGFPLSNTIAVFTNLEFHAVEFHIISWIMTPFNLMRQDKHFRGTYYLHVYWRLGKMYVWNIGIHGLHSGCNTEDNSVNMVSNYIEFSPDILTKVAESTL
jgi:hypothetical protein